MAYIFGQHLYSENRYSWIDEWSAQLPPQDLWFKSGCQPGAWDVQVCEPGVWQPVICGPVPPLDPPASPLTAIHGQIRGEIRPIGSLHAKVDPPDAIAGHITGSVIPVGSLQGTLTLPAVQGTITGVVRPVGSIHASQASEWVGVLPQFGPAHHTSMTVSTITNPNDRIKVNFGSGTGQSLDRLPGGKVVWKIHVVQASGVDSRLGMSEELAPGASELAYPPGFAMQGVTLKQDGSLYDGFPRPGPGVTFGTGSYILQGRDSAQGNWWVGTTDATGTNVVWHGDPLAGTGEAWKFPDPAAHAAVFGSSGDIFEFVPTVASEIPGRAPLGIHGVVHPVGSLHGLVTTPAAVTGTITGVVRPVGSLQGTVGGAPFTPTDLANLQALWDADSIAGADNSDIGATSIIDSSGNGRNSIGRYSPATLRTAFLNGHKAIRAPGGACYYDTANFMAGYTQGTMFWVAKTDADNSANEPPFNFNNGSGGQQHYPYSDNHIYSSAGTTARKDAGAAGAGKLNAWHIVTIRSANGLWEFRLNGSVLFTTAVNTVAFTTTPHFFTELGTPNFLGHVAVIGLYSTAYSQADCQKIEGYFAHRYGLTGVLPAGHPYKTTPP